MLLILIIAAAWLLTSIIVAVPVGKALKKLGERDGQ